ncbi:aminotransferase class I/II-fold pyridoxal phosphate-dependent enzyme [Proteus mirabilis]|uniref:threonine aldolase family protein n=1 Tax=Proteus mirabilis TaxID=584 RepID=UPI001C2C7898|nr:aminotransferase class I/II-fold pyridoxal phosphate-dependent enzyme [Proteus mirabilis]MBU9977690.1 aminotransferase class I/II-fold pyridoxal phosphate-dependent enzyme [Proteus mirabilis]
MYRFQNDYNEIAHPAVMKAITDTVGQRYDGYGMDTLCHQTKELIKQRIKQPEAQIHFFNGGTITNLTAISHFLRPHQAVISVSTGHIATHETGAIEATGHKVITTFSTDGKLTPDLLKPILAEHNDEHWVQPKLVYITNATEIGTVYRKAELQALREFCDAHNLWLYLDGARLATGLMSSDSDLTIEDIAHLTDAFYIGGTKIGAMAAEALVICHPALSTDFRFSLKQKGGLQAKGWLLGAQFAALFSDDLYFKLGKHLNEMASQLATFFSEHGFNFSAPPESNQVFVILPNDIAKKLTQQFVFHRVLLDDPQLSCLRLCTSWATTQQDIDDFKVKFLKLI